MKTVNKISHLPPLKKIAIASNTSWYIFNFRANLIKSLIKNGYQVFAISPEDEYSSMLLELGCRNHHINIDSKNKNPIKDILLLFSFIKILKKTKPDILLSFTTKPNIYGTLAAYYCHIPTINNIAGLGVGFVNESVTTKILRTLYRISQKKASHVFFQNNDDFLEFIDEKLVIAEKCSVLPGSGIDLTKFQYSPVPKRIENKFIFLLVARVLYSKGIEVLFLAAKQIYESGNHNFFVQVLGDTGINNSDTIPISILNNWENEPFFKYLGKTDNVIPFIEKAHCIILPSYYREGTPKSLLEGLAIGRPIITTNMPGCKTTVIANENGYLVPPHDVDALATKMKSIMSLDIIELNKMGVKSRRLAEEVFDENIVIQKYIEEIKRLQ